MATESTVTVKLDLEAVEQAIAKMFRSAPETLLRNPLSEALADSFLVAGGEFKAMVAEVVNGVIRHPDTRAAVRTAVLWAMREEAQKIGRRVARQMAMNGDDDGN